MNKLIEKLIRN